MNRISTIYQLTCHVGSHCFTCHLPRTQHHAIIPAEAAHHLSTNTGAIKLIAELSEMARILEQCRRESIDAQSDCINGICLVLNVFAQLTHWSWTPKYACQSAICVSGSKCQLWCQRTRSRSTASLRFQQRKSVTMFHLSCYLNVLQHFISASHYLMDTQVLQAHCILGHSQTAINPGIHINSSEMAPALDFVFARLIHWPADTFVLTGSPRVNKPIEPSQTDRLCNFFWASNSA